MHIVWSPTQYYKNLRLSAGAKTESIRINGHCRFPTTSDIFLRSELNGFMSPRSIISEWRLVLFGTFCEVKEEA